MVEQCCSFAYVGCFHSSAGLLVCSVADIVEFVKRVFGNVSTSSVCIGENSGWYLDQRLISILVKRYTDGHGDKAVKLVHRDARSDRSGPFYTAQHFWMGMNMRLFVTSSSYLYTTRIYSNLMLRHLESASLLANPNGLPEL